MAGWRSLLAAARPTAPRPAGLPQARTCARGAGTAAAAWRASRSRTRSTRTPRWAAAVGSSSGGQQQRAAARLLCLLHLLHLLATLTRQRPPVRAAALQALQAARPALRLSARARWPPRRAWSTCGCSSTSAALAAPGWSTPTCTRTGSPGSGSTRGWRRALSRSACRVLPAAAQLLVLLMAAALQLVCCCRVRAAGDTGGCADGSSACSCPQVPGGRRGLGRRALHAAAQHRVAAVRPQAAAGQAAARRCMVLLSKGAACRAGAARHQPVGGSCWRRMPEWDVWARGCWQGPAEEFV